MLLIPRRQSNIFQRAMDEPPWGTLSTAYIPIILRKVFG